MDRHCLFRNDRAYSHFPVNPYFHSDTGSLSEVRVGNSVSTSRIINILLKDSCSITKRSLFIMIASSASTSTSSPVTFSYDQIKLDGSSCQ